MNLEKFTEPICFDNFKTDQVYKAIGKTFSCANVYGIDVVYTTGNRFLLRNFTMSNTLNGSDYHLDKLKASTGFVDLLKEIDIESLDDVAYELNGVIVVEAQMFWPLLLWLNLYKFAKAYLLMLSGLNFDKDEIKVQPVCNHTEMYDFVNWFDINVQRRIDNGYLSFQSAAREVVREFKIPKDKQYPRPEETAKKVRINKFVELWHDASGKEPFKLEYPDHPENSSKFYHPNALLLYLLNMYPLQTISMLNSFYLEEFDYDYQINLSNSMVSKINDDFGYARHDDLIVKFHIPTNYIHIRSTADALNPTKWSKHQGDFWKDKDTQEFMDEINNYIINHLESGYFAKSQASQPATDLDVGLVDGTNYGETDEKSTTENNEEHENLLEYTDENIIKQLKLHPCYFDLNKGCPREIIGRFIHIDLFMYALFWISKKRAIRYIRMVNILCHKSAVMNIKLKTMYENEIALLKKCNEELTTENETLKERLLETNYLNGSLKLTLIANKLKLQHENYNQVETSSSIVIKDLFDSKTKRDKVYNYVKENRSKILTLGRTRNQYLVNDGYELEEIIDHIYYILAYNSEELFTFNEQEYRKRKDYFDLMQTNQAYGFLFESEMSRKYNAFLYKDLPDSYIMKFGLTHRDTGIDLVDIQNKKLYQCKCYSGTLRMSDQLQRSKEMLNKFKVIDEDYELFLIVNEGADIQNVDIDTIYEKTSINTNPTDQYSINEFIALKMNQLKPNKIANLINENSSIFSDFKKELTPAAVSRRKARIIKQMEDCK